MSILIKSGVMPLTCEECPCYDNNDYSCNVTGRGVIEYRFDGRPDGCPLVEIPTPHGRLIDADILRNKLERHRDMCGDVELAHGIDVAIRILNNAPTIIEAEVSEE